jgi:glycosyltransferase involved in cell wall biosynthesis
MMASLVVFSRYFGTSSRGGERSSYSFIKEREHEFDRVIVILFKNSRTGQGFHFTDPSWEIVTLSGLVEFRRLRYLEFIINLGPIVWQLRRRLRNMNLSDTRWYTYGFYAPLLLFLSGSPQVLLSIRDETGLGWNFNYHQGKMRLIKSITRALEYPLFLIWRSLLNKTFRRAKAIYTNSDFMRDQVLKIVPEKANQVYVAYPAIDEQRIKSEYLRVPSETFRIGMVGDNARKGSDFFRKLAICIPACDFHVIDRRNRTEQRTGNLVSLPWETSIGRVYSKIDLLLVPSRWHEAYGRVVHEALILGIPVIANDLGGIKEACIRSGVDKSLYSLIQGLEVGPWIREIKAFEARTHQGNATD